MDINTLPSKIKKQRSLIYCLFIFCYVINYPKFIGVNNNIYFFLFSVCKGSGQILVLSMRICLKTAFGYHLTLWPTWGLNTGRTCSQTYSPCWQDSLSLQLLEWLWDRIHIQFPIMWAAPNSSSRHGRWLPQKEPNEKVRNYTWGK